MDDVPRVPVWESTSECRVDGVGRLKFDFHTARNGWKRIDRSPRRRVIHASTASYVSVGTYAAQLPEMKGPFGAWSTG